MASALDASLHFLVISMQRLQVFGTFFLVLAVALSLVSLCAFLGESKQPHVAIGAGSAAAAIAFFAASFRLLKVTTPTEIATAGAMKATADAPATTEATSATTATEAAAVES